MDASKRRMLRMGALLAASLAAAPSWGQTGSAASRSQTSNAYEQACRSTVEKKGIPSGLQGDFMLQCAAGERLDHNPPKGRKG
jgi:hypothetical protein